MGKIFEITTLCFRNFHKVNWLQSSQLFKKNCVAQKDLLNLNVNFTFRFWIVTKSMMNLRWSFLRRPFYLGKDTKLCKSFRIREVRWFFVCPQWQENFVKKRLFDWFCFICYISNTILLLPNFYHDIFIFYGKKKIKLSITKIIMSHDETLKSLQILLCF